MGNVYTSRKSRKILVSYVCSNCKSLITMEGDLEAFGRSGHKGNAEKASEKAYADAVYAISMASQKPFLVHKMYEFEDEVAKNTINAFKFMNMEKNCAYCGHHELWQNPTDRGLTYDSVDWSGKLRVNSIKGVPEESRPHFLDTGNDNLAWRENILKQSIVERMHYWDQNPEETEKLKAQAEGYLKQIEELQAKCDSADAPCASLRKEIEAKKEEAKNFSFLSGERRALNKEVSALEKQWKKLDKEASDLTFNLKKQIVELKKQRKELLIANPGLTGNLNTLSSSKEPFYELMRYE